MRYFLTKKKKKKKNEIKKEKEMCAQRETKLFLFWPSCVTDYPIILKPYQVRVHECTFIFSAFKMKIMR